MYNFSHIFFRYKEQQRLESIVLEFEESLEKNGATSTPEDEVREYYLSLVRLWCLKAVNELALVEQEKAILQHIRSLPNDAKAKEETAPKRPFKPFIITKTAEQKKVRNFFCLLRMNKAINNLLIVLCDH